MRYAETGYTIYTVFAHSLAYDLLLCAPELMCPLV